MNEKAKILRARAKMCKSIINCDKCKILELDKTKTCIEIICENPEKAVEIIEAWEKEHRTYLEDFLEKYPNAPMENDNVPCACRTHLYLCNGDETKCGFCAECWGEIMGVQNDR